MNLFVINETFTNNYRIEVLSIISVLIILCGIYVIISKNPIVSVLFLIGLFAGVSSYLIMIGSKFYRFILSNSLYRSCIYIVSFYINVN